MPEGLTLPQMITAAISIAALVVSLVSLHRTSRLQRQQIRLLAKQEAGLSPSLSLYLAEAYIRRLGPGAPRTYVFQIVVSNSSDAANSIRDVRLVIEHERAPGGPSSTLVIAHKPELAARLTDVSGEPLRLPCAIPGRTSVGGLALFEVASNLLRESRVESYILQVADTYGHETSVEAMILREQPK